MVNHTPIYDCASGSADLEAESAADGIYFFSIEAMVREYHVYKYIALNDAMS